MNSTIKATNSQRTGKNQLFCKLDKMTLEEAQTIRDALAVLTEEKAERAGIKWDNEGVRERLLLSFIGICENMESLQNGE